jgi:hypothetical protein
MFQNLNILPIMPQWLELWVIKNFSQQFETAAVVSKARIKF